MKISSSNILVSMVAFILLSCSSFEPPPEEYYKNGLVDFAMDIAENPEKLYYLDSLYLQFYDEEFLFITLNNPSSIGNLVEKIKNNFSVYEEKIIQSSSGFDHENVNSYNIFFNTNYDFKDYDFCGISLIKEKSEASLSLYFVKTDTSKFYIFDIICCTFNKRYKRY